MNTFGFIVHFMIYVLCNKSSIDAAYSSNHTLQSLKGSQSTHTPNELRSLLFFNQNANKRVAAIEKILYSHMLDDFDFAPSTWPRLFSRIATSDSSMALSTIHEILRKNPHEIKNKHQGKRKAQEMNELE
jgi:hypothetical protein